MGGSGHRNAMMMGRGHGVAHGGHITIVLGSPCCPQGKEVLLHSGVDAARGEEWELSSSPPPPAWSS